MTLKDVIYFVQFVATQNGKKIDVKKENLNRALQFANLELMKQVYGRTGDPTPFETEHRLADELNVFKTTSTLALTDGIGTVPTDYWHKIRMETTSGGVDVRFVAGEECVQLRNNTITGPTTTYPIVEMLGSTFQVYPISITSVKLTYLKISTPEYVVTTTNGYPEYDSGSSTELLWNDDKLIDIIRIMLGYFNIPVTNEQVLGYVEQKQKEDN